jgi:hypothetical protein
MSLDSISLVTEAEKLLCRVHGPERVVVAACFYVVEGLVDGRNGADERTPEREERVLEI